MSAPYRFGDWSWQGENPHSKTNLRHHKYEARVWDVPTGWDWHTEVRKMYPFVPDEIQGEKIDKNLMEYADRGINGLFVIAYSEGWGDSEELIGGAPYRFDTWEYQGIVEHPETNTIRHKWQAQVRDLGWTWEWERESRLMYPYVPLTLDDQTIDRSVTNQWVNQIAGAYVIIYSEPVEEDTELIRRLTFQQRLEQLIDMLPGFIDIVVEFVRDNYINVLKMTADIFEAIIDIIIQIFDMLIESKQVLQGLILLIPVLPFIYIMIDFI